MHLAPTILQDSAKGAMRFVDGNAVNMCTLYKCSGVESCWEVNLGGGPAAAAASAAPLSF